MVQTKSRADELKIRIILLYPLHHNKAFAEEVYDFFWRRMNYLARFDIDRIRVYVF